MLIAATGAVKIGIVIFDFFEDKVQEGLLTLVEFFDYSASDPGSFCNDDITSFAQL
jgi:hypothetical protein